MTCACRVEIQDGRRESVLAVAFGPLACSCRGVRSLILSLLQRSAPYPVLAAALGPYILISLSCNSTRQVHVTSLGKYLYFRLKGTVSVISSDPICKYGNSRFTTAPLYALSELYINQCFFKLLIFICGFSA